MKMEVLTCKGISHRDIPFSISTKGGKTKRVNMWSV